MAQGGVGRGELAIALLLQRRAWKHPAMAQTLGKSFGDGGRPGTETLPKENRSHGLKMGCTPQ